MRIARTCFALLSCEMLATPALALLESEGQAKPRDRAHAHQSGLLATA